MPTLLIRYEPGPGVEDTITRFALGHGAIDVQVGDGEGAIISPDLIGSQSLRAKWEMSPIITGMEIVE